MRKYALKIAAIYALKVLQQIGDEKYFKYAVDRQEFWGKVAQLPPESLCWKLIQRYFELMFDPATPRNHSQAIYELIREKL